MSAIAELKMLVVLADKVGYSHNNFPGQFVLSFFGQTLYYYRFEELVNFNKTPPQHILDDNTGVSFYRVGYLPERTFLVVLARRKDVRIFHSNF